MDHDQLAEIYQTRISNELFAEMNNIVKENLLKVDTFLNTNVGELDD